MSDFRNTAAVDCPYQITMYDSVTHGHMNTSAKQKALYAQKKKDDMAKIWEVGNAVITDFRDSGISVKQLAAEIEVPVIRIVDFLRENGFPTIRNDGILKQRVIKKENK